MSYFDYQASRKISETDPPFYALIMAAMRKADSSNIAKLRSAFPSVCEEFEARYHAPGGQLPSDGLPVVDLDADESKPHPLRVNDAEVRAEVAAGIRAMNQRQDEERRGRLDRAVALLRETSKHAPSNHPVAQPERDR